MRNLVSYRQSLTISTGKWNTPCRKEEEGWIFIGHAQVASLYDYYVTNSFPLAIIKMKRIIEKGSMWSCKMTSKQASGYRIYHLICKRIRKQ